LFTAALGIGVRLAVYIQAVLCLWPSIAPFAINALNLSSPPATKLIGSIRKSMWSLILTGAALLVASHIKAGGGRLSPHHAAVVLNLNWIIFLSAYTSRLSATALFRFWDDGHKEKAHAGKEYILLSIHLIGTGTLGFLLFYNVDGFAPDGGCARDTVLWTFGSYTHLVAPHFRKFWLNTYALALIPVVNVLLADAIQRIFVVIFAVLHILIWGRPRQSLAHSALVAITALPVIGIAVLIVSTEKTIARNPVADGGQKWGFGQILALLLLVIPIADVIDDVNKLRNLCEERRELLQLASV
jgi:hypothetical protein